MTRSRLVGLVLVLVVLGVGRPVEAQSWAGTPPPATFDANFYAQCYPWIPRVLGADASLLYHHWRWYGRFEGLRSTKPADGSCPLVYGPYVPWLALEPGRLYVDAHGVMAVRAHSVREPWRVIVELVSGQDAGAVWTAPAWIPAGVWVVR